MNEINYELELRVKTLFTANLSEGHSTPKQTRVLVNPSPNIKASGWEVDGMVTRDGMKPAVLVASTGIASLILLGVQMGVYKDAADGLKQVTDIVNDIANQVENISADKWQPDAHDGQTRVS